MQFKLFKKIPVIIQPTFWLLLLFFSIDFYSDLVHMILFMAVFCISLLAHEYGHALAAIKCGRQPQITLEAFGGYVSYRTQGLHEKQQFFITCSGPLFTSLLIGISYYLVESQMFSLYWVNCFLYYMMKLNTYWLIFNLMPLYPLDGGQMAHYLLRKWFGEERGELFRLVLGNMAAVIGFIYYGMHESWIFSFLLVSYGIKNFQAYQAYVLKQRKEETPFTELNRALKMIEEQQVMEAKTLLQRLIRSKDSYIRDRSLENLASVLEKLGQDKEAYALLLNSDVSNMSEGKWLLCKLAYQEKNYNLVAQYAHDIYKIRPQFETALLNTKAFLGLNEKTLASGWLNTANQFEEARGKNIDLETIKGVTP